MSGSWYNTGFGGIEAEQRRLDEAKGPGRIWIPGGASKDVVWVDGEPVCIYEHNPKINGNFRNWLTCLQGVYDDVVCCKQLGPSSRYYAGYLTVVDCSEWKDQRGTIHKYELRLIQLKLRSLKKFRRKAEERSSMIASMWRLTREDDNAAACGDEWEFKRDVNMEKMFSFVNYRGKSLEELFSEAEGSDESMVRVRRLFQVEPNEEGKLPRVVPPFNYFEILKPKSPKELNLILGAVQEEDGDNQRFSGSSGGGSGSIKEEDVPF